MSNKATLGPISRMVLIGLVLAASAVAQAPDWRRVGNAAIDLQLAGLATGPVDRAWYSPAGDRIWIQTSSGKTFETNDFDRWTPAPADTPAPPAPEGRSITLPEDNSQVRNPAGPPAGVCLRPVRVPLRQQRQELGQSDGVSWAVHCRRQPQGPGGFADERGRNCGGRIGWSLSLSGRGPVLEQPQ